MPSEAVRNEKNPIVRVEMWLQEIEDRLDGKAGGEVPPANVVQLAPDTTTNNELIPQALTTISTEPPPNV